MYKAFSISVFCCILLGCASTDVSRIDREIQKASYEKSEHRDDVIKFIKYLKPGDSCDHVKILLEEKKFEYVEKLEKRTRVDGKEISKVKKITFWDAEYAEDMFTLLFQCENTSGGLLKAAYHGVTEIQFSVN